MSFGALLRTTRQQLEVSALAVAVELRVAEWTVQRWESEAWTPAEMRTVMRIARFLGVDPLPLLVAWARERGGFTLPTHGDDRDKAAAVLALCWSEVPATGAITVTLEQEEPALRLVRD